MAPRTSKKRPAGAAPTTAAAAGAKRTRRQPANHAPTVNVAGKRGRGRKRGLAGELPPATPAGQEATLPPLEHQTPFPYDQEIVEAVEPSAQPAEQPAITMRNNITGTTVRGQDQISDNPNDASASLVETVTGLIRTIRDVAMSEGGSRAGGLKYLKELPEFRGNPLKWTHFEAMYRESTRNYGYSDRENLARLQKAVRGKAADRVGTLLDTATDPGKVIESLRMQFGSRAAIASTISDDIYQLRSLKDGKCNIVTFASGVSNAVSAFKSVGMSSYLADINLMRSVLEKLPGDLKQAYCDYAAEIVNDEATNLEKLADFLQRKASNTVKSGVLELEAARSRYHENNRSRGGRNTHKRDDGASRRNREYDVPRRHAKSSRDEYVFTTTAQARSSSCERDTNRENGCVFCHRGAHNITECSKFSRETVHRRHSLAKQFRLCFRCLKSGHMSRECSNQAGCEICGKAHHVKLHIGDRGSNTENRDSEHRARNEYSNSNAGAREGHKEKNKQ